jgi:hypothetical protein
MRGVHGGVGETHDPVRDVDRLAARGDIAEAGVQVDVRHRRPHLKADPDRPDHLKNAGLGVAGEGKNIRSGFQAAVVGGPADKPTAVPAMGGVGSGRQVGVLHPAAPRRGHRRAGGTRAGPACRRVPRAGLHASGMRLQPRATHRHRLCPPPTDRASGVLDCSCGDAAVLGRPAGGGSWGWASPPDPVPSSTPYTSTEPAGRPRRLR